MTYRRIGFHSAIIKGFSGLVVGGLVPVFVLGCQPQAKAPGGQAPEAQRVAEPARTATAEPNQPPQPKILLESLEYTMGDVSPGSKSTAKFEFSNVGAGTLQITNLQGCCGSVVKTDKYKLAPGEKGLLTVDYPAPGEPGAIQKNVSFRTNDKQNPLVVLTFKLNVIETLRWKPDRLKLFLQRENAGCSAIVVTALDQKAFSVKQVFSTGDCMSMAFDPNVRQTEFVLQPQVDMGKLKENPQGMLRVEVDRSDYPALFFRYDLLPNYGHTPIQVLVWDADPSVVVERKVGVVDNYCDANRPADFEIESVVSDSNCVQLLSTDPIPTGFNLRIAIKPPAPVIHETSFRDELRIKVKGSDEVIRVAINGYYSQKVRDNASLPATQR